MTAVPNPPALPPLDCVVVTAQQMQAIESSIFAAGMPVAALMEKVAGRVATWIMRQYPRDRAAVVGVIVGPGNNGGDALVVARELHHHGYQILLWCPFNRMKELPAQHRAYLEALDISCTGDAGNLQFCDLIIDGGFGLGLTRPLEGDFATGINDINSFAVPVVSIDLPSGLATDSGQVLGTAIAAEHTLCLGLWKLGLLQDQARPYVGHPHLIPFDIPDSMAASVLRGELTARLIGVDAALSRMPLPRSPIAHKYKTGHALLIAGSRQFAGAALLTGQGAVASGVGMLTLIVPESIRLMVVSQLPEALVLGAEETEQGAIATLPSSIEWAHYDVVACGPGLTPSASNIVNAALQSDRPLVLDADGLNILAQQSPVATLSQRSAATLLTPHPGEFRRLFPDISASVPNGAAQTAAASTNSTVLLKGAITAIAHPKQPLWLNSDSSPALARGGSGDVLTGLIAGLAAQLTHHAPNPEQLLNAAIAGVWWHAQTGRHLAQQQTELGCSANQLSRSLTTVLAQAISASISRK